MKIVSIFASKLYSFHYDHDGMNIYHKLMDQWMDVSFLRSYGKDNQVKDLSLFIKEILADAEYIQSFMSDTVNGINNIDSFFRPLDNTERGHKVLSKQKGRKKGSELRIYAIRIDKGLYVVTGGAIKFANNFRMSDHADTAYELIQLNKAQAFLNLNGVVDDLGFFEFINQSENE